jgi:hypothetical protein
MGSILGVASNVLYYGLDAASKITRDFDATSNVAKLFGYAIQFLNRDLESQERILQPLAATLKVVTDCSAIRNWASKVVTLITGEAVGATEAARIYLDAGVTFPNVIKLASITCFLASDILGSLKWLDNLEIVSLGKMAQGVGSIPVLGQTILSYTLVGTIGTLASVGTILDLAETVRDMAQNNFSYYKMTQALGDVAKLAGMVLIGATGNILVFAIIANSAACVCTFARFIMKNYRVGM